MEKTEVIKQQQKKQEKIQLCVQCKTFYGSVKFQNMCSSCYKIKQPSASLQPVQQKKQEPPKQDPQPDKTRCFACRKKVGLLGVKCKCDFIFCNVHRMPENHDCGVDYKKIAQQKLEKDNAMIKHQKVQQI